MPVQATAWERGGDRQRSSTAPGTGLGQADLEARRRAEWKGFYAELHEAPVPRT